MILSAIPNRMLSSSAKIRVPAIRFRHGVSKQQGRNEQQPAANVAAAQSSSQRQQQPGEPIYDFQLPLRFRRRPLEEDEIAYINRGGPE